VEAGHEINDDLPLIWQVTQRILRE